MSTRVWIVGPIAWDTVIYIDDFPISGGFAQCKERIDRPGGTAGNVALALASTGVETGFVTYLGNDQFGKDLESLLRNSEIKNLAINKIDGPSSHVLVTIDKSANRTIFGLNKSYLNLVNLDKVDLRPDDIVCFVLWRDYFIESLRKAQQIGCKIVVGIEALADPTVTHADVAVGSLSDFEKEENLEKHLNRFERIVATKGANGAVELSRGKRIYQPSIATKVVDTTGAGDSFLAGYLAAYANGIHGEVALEIGARWAAMMVSMTASIPPRMADVPGLIELLEKN